jgi:hypothetical protein
VAAVAYPLRQIRAPRPWVGHRSDDEYFRRMPDDIVLRLDRATAEDLYAALYEAGEHIAAGAPIIAPSAEEIERLGRFLQDLGHALGRRCSPDCDHL